MLEATRANTTTSHNFESGLSFKNAVITLNKLQSNALTIQKSIATNNQANKFNDNIKYLQRSGLKFEDLDKLSIIHVSGTKGKGSTCAVTESILRHYKVKTGFFSSPHLVSITERFRINGEPISEYDFTRNFWKVYNNLNQQKTSEEDMPSYFRFLTILCFHIFLQQRVDVAILEVGIGGEFDCTNIVRNTKTVGITSLGLEHTNLLGHSLAEIAWQKAGIIKKNSTVYTVDQPEECISVIWARAKEKNACVLTVPQFDKYIYSREINLQSENKAIHYNYSLAIQLAFDWLKKNKVEKLNGFAKKTEINKITLELTEEAVSGIENCFWPGRWQVIQYDNKWFYLDGAHTSESLYICSEWFNKAVKDRFQYFKNQNKSIYDESKHYKCLIFNVTGYRDATKFLDILHKNIDLNLVLFVPNIPFETYKNFECDNITWNNELQIKRVNENKIYWQQISNTIESKSFKNIFDALTFLENNWSYNEDIHILVTGSIHLVGATIEALEKYNKDLFSKN